MSYYGYFCAYFVYLNLLSFCKAELKDEEMCVNKDGEMGKCTALSNCESALALIDIGKSPVFCNPGTEVNFNALVCCKGLLVEKENLRERPSLEKCKKYYPHIFMPDWPNTFRVQVVSGTRTLAKEFPHMALIGYGDEDDIRWMCGGSLISEKFVLTAAHCIHTTSGPPSWVRLGELDTANHTDDAAPQNLRVIKATAYPSYEVTSYYHDIGVLELEREVKFSDYIKPACLYQSNDLALIPSALATGWGNTFFGGKPSSHLMKVDLVVVNNSRCNSLYKNLPRNKFPDGIVHNIQICAGGNDGKDTCQGDSGGPLQIVKPESKKRRNLGGNVYDIIGITSFGTACGLPDKPGIFTRISYYLEWIERTIWSS